ncbi:septal ring lytic transglycosylase RlpA family protein [Shewanella fodinae]|jgi:rare lipoprotein A|uniref:septal ring lytic transglycosylase RlpA family protein n=1 Tax=Shewanella fodinae TaxID=552357 RepID=UPI001679E6EC|nr:septal ring lytic transglycosylase RlpA family protein [Shewanella fodinae]MCL2907155.1 septal ring lytic transglycosylase RlpA family protein [Shewanella fodinae]GGZ06649.1 septal ring lipoprotein RlpA [Shewanella fodinae]
MPRINWLLPLCVLLLLGGCASEPANRNDGRYSMKHDRPPENPPDLSQVKDATPRYEPYSKQGNKDYEVLGQSYAVLPSGKGFVQEGLASWYASKFHGHNTSNGEIYDMYSMSGAHKTLPIPSYVRVTNLDNNKSVIVRINDRGPFHSNRIIDVSYAAAYKLDMLKTGTAPVRLEVIYNDSPEHQAVAAINSDNAVYYIQIVAASSKEKLQSLASVLEQKFNLQSRVTTAENLYRLQLGPMANEDLANRMLDTIRNGGYPQSYLVRDASAKGG